MDYQDPCDGLAICGDYSGIRGVFIVCCVGIV